MDVVTQPPSERADSGAFQQLRSLPPLSASTTKILSLTLDSESCLADLEQVFRADPGLTADLLITANSAAFCGRARVSTIRHALAILGLDRVRSLATAIAMSRYIRAHIPPGATRAIWRHAIATGVIAELLGKFSQVTSGSVLYTAGLMHDMGRIGLLASRKESYHRFIGAEFLNVEDSEEQEKQTFGVTHTVAGEFLLQAWGFPQTLCDSSRHHHNDKEISDEVRTIRTACIIADALGYGELTLQERPRSTTAEIWLAAHANDSLSESIEATIQAFAV